MIWGEKKKGVRRKTDRKGGRERGERERERREGNRGRERMPRTICFCVLSSLLLYGFNFDINALSSSS